MVNYSEGRGTTFLRPLLVKEPGRLERAGEARGLQPLFPELPVDCRSPVRIAVASVGAGFRGTGDRLEELLGMLPPGSRIRSLRGSVNRCRVEGCGGTCRDAAGVLAWFREWKPDVLFYPSLEDLEFGIHPMGWRQDLRISLRHVLVNAARGPSTVHERLLVREMMIAAGDFWPGGPDDVASPLGRGIPEGLSWLVRGSRAAGELIRWKPQRAAEPRISIIQGQFGGSGKLPAPAGLATLLLGDSTGRSNESGARMSRPASLI